VRMIIMQRKHWYKTVPHANNQVSRSLSGAFHANSLFA
jgi:hypothetical protein